jgi:hypothetical protein
MQIQAHFEKCAIRTQKPGTGPASQKTKTKDGTNKKTRAVVEVGFHSLRHTFVSLCREANAPLAVVEAIVGHSNPAMTRHYTHVGELAATTAVAALPAFVPSANGSTQDAPVNTTTPEKLLRAVNDIVSAMTQKTFSHDKSRILQLLRAVIQ